MILYGVRVLLGTQGAGHHFCKPMRLGGGSQHCKLNRCDFSLIVVSCVMVRNISKFEIPLFDEEINSII